VDSIRRHLGFSGAVNVATRTGTNRLHGSAFIFFRDHKLSAYPALQRSTADPDPFFQRRQFGFTVGGPIQRDRLFFFANWERNEQRGVGTTTFASASTSVKVCGLLAVSVAGLMSDPNNTRVFPVSRRIASPWEFEYLYVELPPAGG